jgi:hypothetical protein
LPNLAGKRTMFHQPPVITPQLRLDGTAALQTKGMPGLDRGNSEDTMKQSTLVLCALAAATTALAQFNARPAPAGEMPPALRAGRARYSAHLDSKQMLRVTVGLSHPHMEEEDQFIQELGNPKSPNYRKYLPEDEFIARFGPSADDEQAVVEWAQSQGLTVTHRFHNRLLVDLEAPAATIERALKVTLNNYAMDNYSYFSNEKEPTLPLHLIHVVQSIGGLNNFPEMSPSIARGVQPPGAIYNPGAVIGTPHRYAIGGETAKGPAQRTADREAKDTTNFTNGLMDPTNIYSSSAYNYDGLHHLNICCNPLSPGNPAGSPPESSIAIAAYGALHWNGSSFPDIDGFHAAHPSLAFNITAIPVDGGPSSCTVTASQPCSNDAEVTMDTEWSGAMSNSFGDPNNTAQLFVYQGGGSVEDVYNAMLSDGHARTFTTSWSCTENSQCSQSTIATRHGIFNSMVNAGWTLMTASGDRGATDDCSSVDVSYPASDWDVIGVGGTLLSLNSDGTFNSETAWVGGTKSGSCSKNNGGSGGGCSSIFSLQSWQNGFNGSCGGQRSVPDMSLDAVGGQDLFFNGKIVFGGGTSISSPMLAGFFAQANAYLLHVGSLTGNNCGTEHAPCAPIGYGTPLLYFIGAFPDNATHYPFYDITQGCNSSDITAANSLSFFCAGPGYDNVTGWGTANMLQLAWAINTAIAGDSAPPNTVFSGPASGTWFNTSQTLNWTVADAAGTSAHPVGVAGFTTNWDSDPGDDARKSTPGTGSNYYAGPAVPLATTGSVKTGAATSGEGCHSLHVRSWDNTGFSVDQASGAMCFDDIPPQASCALPDGFWHATDAVLACNASDANSGLANPADSNFGLTTSVPANSETNNAFTNSHTVPDLAGNSVTKGPYGGNKVDKKPPTVACGSPDGNWHANDVSIACTAGDAGSGLAQASDANFNLTTSVPAGTETNNASTNSHAVPDAVGNTTTAGPIAGNKVDKKPPVITITQPTASNYVHSGTLTLGYTVSDGGSGVATITPTMNGSSTVGASPISNGLVINLLTALPLGPNTFSITAVDKVGNSATVPVTFTIIVTAQSMLQDIAALQASGGLSGNTNSFLAKLNNAASSRSGGNCNAAGNQYGAFINEVQAQTGKSITAQAAAILIADANYLITHCP